MKPPITFQKIETKEQWDALKVFAAEFGHRIDQTSLTPMVLASRGKQPFAYFSMLTAPIVIPAFHPRHTSKRDFVECVQQVRAWGWLNTIGHERFPNGVILAAFDKEPVIERSLIEKLGFHSTGCELWESFVKPEAYS